MKSLTIEQYMKIQLMFKTFKDENKLNREIIKYLGNLEMTKKDSDKLIQDVTNILLHKPDFVQRFFYNGVEYGFIPSLEDITTGEFIDLDDYIKDGEQLNRIASILYRPITSSIGKLYTIETYEGTDKYKDIMNKVDYRIVQGALVFFWNLTNSLLNHSSTYIKNQK